MTALREVPLYLPLQEQMGSARGTRLPGIICLTSNEVAGVWSQAVRQESPYPNRLLYWLPTRKLFLSAFYRC